MAFFASTFDWPSRSIDFVAVEPGASSGAGEIVERGNRYILKAPGHFSFATGQPGIRTLTTTVGGAPALIQGVVFAADGDLGLRIDEVRVGSGHVGQTYSSVNAKFEHLGSLCSLRIEDGAARSPSVPLVLPALGSATEMVANLPSGSNTITITAVVPAVLEEFEEHLVAFQDLLTFAADMPIGRTGLVAVEASGQEVTILGRERYAPFGRLGRRPIEHAFRLAGDWTQTVVERWWAAREGLRPVAQILAGLSYQPGYVEADVILSAASIEALATRLAVGDRPRLHDEDAAPIIAALDALPDMNSDQRQFIASVKADASRTTLRSKVELLISGVNSTATTNSRLSVANWLPRFVETRNAIAHGTNGSRPRQDIWTDDALLRAVRDANRIVLVLAMLTHLGVPTAAIERAGERLGARYGTRHGTTSIFR